MSENQYHRIWYHGKPVWMCSCCRENDKTDIYLSSETKVFLWYVEEIVRTVRGDTKELLDAVKNIHPNLQFTLETTNDKNSLPFLDKSINVQPEGKIFCTWYQKPWDTGKILNYRSCAPPQQKKNIIQWTIPPPPPVPSHQRFGSVPWSIDKKF